MTTRKALGTVGYFLYQVKEGGKRRLDKEGYDNKAREKALAEVKRRDDEHWRRVIRPCLIDQEQR